MVDGSGGKHQVPDCQGAQPPLPEDLNQLISSGAPPAPAPFNCPGTNPPTWHRFYNFGTSVAQGGECGSGGPPIDRGEQLTTQTGPGGFLEDRENAYLFTVLNDRYGEVNVIHAKPPTFPPTFNGESPMAGNTDLRYWSYCTYDLVTQHNYACLFDQAIRRDPDGFVTVTISAPQNRPTCALNWLPFGPDLFSVVILRNQLPNLDPRFEQAVQFAPPLGTQAQLEASMGPYFPSSSYTSKAEFDRQHGCAAAAAAASGAPAGPSLLPFSAGATRALVAGPLLLVLFGLLLSIAAVALYRRREDS
jgi:hypothetical protein